MRSRIKYFFMSLGQRLWVRPAAHALVALCIVVIASLSDRLGSRDFLPDIDRETLRDLMRIIATTMLGVATFAVASMVSAFGSASRSATPRVFKLVISDNNSQYALSTFVGAYIYAIIALIAVRIFDFERTGRFVLFCGTIWMFGWVILTFVRWVDNIARLGLMNDTIDKCQTATRQALRDWGPDRVMGCREGSAPENAIPVLAPDSAHVELVDLQALESWAGKAGARVYVTSPPGAFTTLRRPLAHVAFDREPEEDPDLDPVRQAFVTGIHRSFQTDPRFGLIALSEIASRALSPAVNDPGTAIDILRRMIVIFEGWDEILLEDPPDDVMGHVFVEALSERALFEDAFRGIERDGAGFVEVGLWLQNCYRCLAACQNAGIRDQAIERSRTAMRRAEEAIGFNPDLEILRRAAGDVGAEGPARVRASR